MTCPPDTRTKYPVQAPPSQNVTTKDNKGRKDNNVELRDKIQK